MHYPTFVVIRIGVMPHIRKVTYSCASPKALIDRIGRTFFCGACTSTKGEIGILQLYDQILLPQCQVTVM